MGQDIHLLDSLELASPCSAKWSEMEGNNQKRYCKQCCLNVYNFAEMTRREAERIVESNEGRLCGILYRRADGTVLTRDCPVGVAALRKRLAISLSWIGTATLACIGVLSILSGFPDGSIPLRSREPFKRLCNWLAPLSPPMTVPVGGLAYPGRMSISPPKTKPGSIAKPMPAQPIRRTAP